MQNQHSFTLLDKILKKRILRVGTTGDYKPFSFVADDGRYQGIDIELADHLGTSLGVKVEFVKTSWVNLLQDLKENKFDIVMGGLAKNAERESFGVFSNGYFKSGKTPIARCEDRLRFGSLEMIDDASVKIIVNPGGTNEKFVRERIRNAQIIVYDDIPTIFDQIILRNADVMITDAVEVDFVVHHQSSLCATMKGVIFDEFEYAYLMQRDSKFNEYVNAWLEKQKLTGNIKRAFSKFLNT